jgi:hypothetical protein
MTTPIKLWRYHLPNINGEGWAIIVIGSDGFFSAVSDYGNYGYFWSHHGCADIREFFLRAAVEWDYFRRKLSPEEDYDSEKTYQNIRSCILDGRRGGGRRAREEWDRLHESDVPNGDIIAFHDWYRIPRFRMPTAAGRAPVIRQLARKRCRSSPRCCAQACGGEERGAMRAWWTVRWLLPVASGLRDGCPDGARCRGCGRPMHPTLRKRQKD